MYFYPTVNCKFPMHPAEYAAHSTTFRENMAINPLAGLFGPRNLFILDLEDPVSVKQRMGHVDIPVTDDESECVIAVEDYLDDAPGGSGLHNCDLYDTSDPRVLQFAVFAVDAPSAQAGVPEHISSGIDIPPSCYENMSMRDATNSISETMAEISGLLGVTALSTELGRGRYFDEYIGFTFDVGAISNEKMAHMLRTYVNYRKYNDGESDKIQLYFNYANYINSPYLRVKSGRTYVDTIEGTYLSLKPGEDGTLDIVLQFRYYRGNSMCGYRNVKVASYQVYNISDDKPKFIIKRIYSMRGNDASNDEQTPQAYLAFDDVTVDVNKELDDGVSAKDFDLVLRVDSSIPLKYPADIYIAYPSDFVQFRREFDQNEDYALDASLEGYAKLTLRRRAGAISVPMRTANSMAELMTFGTQRFSISIDRSEIAGENSVYAQVETKDCSVTLDVKRDVSVLNVLKTDDMSEDEVHVFDMEYDESGDDGTQAFKYMK